jgi:hypothetical protein
MPEMRPLENWVCETLERSVRELNLRYANDEAVSRELEAVIPRKAHRNKIHCEHVSSECIESLHKKLRNETCESGIWEALLRFLGDPLPSTVAHDLIDREIAVLDMGHTRQCDEIQWRLSELVEEALLTLIMERYVDERYDQESFLEVFNPHSAHGEVLEMLSFHIASCREKEEIFLDAASQNVEFLSDLKSQERIAQLRQIRTRLEQIRCAGETNSQDRI